MKSAIITGVIGQDGSYLAELLLSKGYEVHGLIRRHSTPCTQRIDHIDDANFFLHHGDVTDTLCLSNLLREVQPDEGGNETVNAGTDKEISIKALAELVAEIIGYDGEIFWDASKPNGTPRKLLDVSKAKALGWTYKTDLRDGIKLAYEDFLRRLKQCK